MKIRESELRGLVRESIKRVLKENKNKYVNMDVELPSSGRTGVKITPTEFTEHVEKVAIEVEYEANGKIKWKDIVNIIRNQCWKKEHKNSLKDLFNDISKVKWDPENVDYIGDLRDYNGMPYVIVSAGGDWEIPVIFMVYWDGNKFRGYIPTKGNTFDRQRKEALGNNEEEDNKYVRKYGVGNYNDVHYNIDACIEDFRARVKVK